MSFLSDIENFISGAETFLGNFFKTAAVAEVSALMPIATQAVATLTSDLAASGGNLEAFGNAAGKALQAAGTAAVAASIEATGASLLQAVSSAISAVQPKVTVTAAVTPAPTVPPASP